MTQPKRPLKVFLCHAHADGDSVRALYTRLTNDGVDAWLDKEKLLPGQSWKFEIEKAVRESNVVIVCLSKKFNLEGFKQREVRWALDQALEKPEGTIFIIPARLEECEVINSLDDWHWVDLFENNGYEMLMRALRARAKDIGATLQINKSWFPKITSPLPKKQKSVENKLTEASKEEILYTADNLPLPPEFPDGWDQKWQPVIETKEPNIVYKPQEEKTTVPRPKKGLQLPKNLNRNFIGVFGFIVLVMASIFGLPSLLNSPVETPSPTQTVTISVLEPQTPKPSATPSIPTSTKTLAFLPTENFTPSPLFEIGSTKVSVMDEMVMLYVPEGEFTMGTDDYDITVRPVHTVYLDSFWIDKTEVTNSMYTLCYQDGACPEPYYGGASYTNFPVTYVSWDDAEKYCSWAGRRLPTEAEWEKAARGVDERTYSWGNNAECGYTNALYLVDTKCPTYKAPKEVGSYSLLGTSPYGALDMIGNVWEWVYDWYDYNYYTESQSVNNPLGPSTGNFRVIRGGSFYNGSRPVEPWFRNSVGIATTWFRGNKYPNTTENNIGFRCASD